MKNIKSYEDFVIDKYEASIDEAFWNKTEEEKIKKLESKFKIAEEKAITYLKRYDKTGKKSKKESYPDWKYRILTAMTYGTPFAASKDDIYTAVGGVGNTNGKKSSAKMSKEEIEKKYAILFK